MARSGKPERKVDERGEKFTGTPTRFSSDMPAAEFVSEIDLPEARRAAHEAMLQEKVYAGRINESEKAYRMARFEKGEVVAMKQAELREARELASAAILAEQAGRKPSGFRSSSRTVRKGRDRPHD